MRKTKAPVPGVYKLTNPIDEVYIGSSRSLKRRKEQYQRSFASACGENLYNSFIKYGVKGHKFEVLEKLQEGVSRAELELLEECYVKMYEELGVKILNKNYSVGNLGVRRNVKGRKKKFLKISTPKRSTSIKKVNLVTGEEEIFPSIQQALKDLDMSYGKLLRLIKNKKVYKDCSFERNSPRIKCKYYKGQYEKRKIAMFDYTTKKVLKQFNSIGDAAKAVNANRYNISQCLIGMLLSTPRNKYYWKYLEDLSKDELKELELISNKIGPSK